MSISVYEMVVKEQYLLPAIIAHVPHMLFTWEMKPKKDRASRQDHTACFKPLHDCLTVPKKMLRQNK